MSNYYQGILLVLVGVSLLTAIYLFYWYAKGRTELPGMYYFLIRKKVKTTKYSRFSYFALGVIWVILSVILFLH